MNRIFDWLYERGWLSPHGTPWDYFMVLVVIPAPVIAPLVIFAWWVG